MSRGNESHRHAGADIRPIVPVIDFGGDRRIVTAYDGVVAERRDDARAMRFGEPRQRRDIEMVVVRVRDENDVDRRQVSKGDARIVDTFRPGEFEWRRT